MVGAGLVAGCGGDGRTTWDWKGSGGAGARFGAALWDGGPCVATVCEPTGTAKVGVVVWLAGAWTDAEACGGRLGGLFAAKGPVCGLAGAEGSPRGVPRAAGAVWG